MQHALDLHRRDGRALKRRQQNAPQRVAKGQPETTLKRLGDDSCVAQRIGAGINVELVRFDKLFPVILNHVFDPTINGGAVPAVNGYFFDSGPAPPWRGRKTGLDATTFWRSATVMRDFAHVTNGRDDKAHCLQRTQRRLTP